MWSLLRSNQNAKLYVLIGFFRSLWFTEAIWYFYWGRFTSYTSIGVIFAVITIANLLAEIPSGIFADRYGRKKSVIVGIVAIFLGVLIMAAAPSAIWLFAGALVSNVGQAFVSGAMEALVYDSMIVDGTSSQFAALTTFKTQASLVAYLIAVPLGGWIYQYHFRGANLLEAIFSFIVVLLSLLLRESKNFTLDTSIPRFSDLKQGFRHLFSKIFMPFLLIIFLLETTFMLYDWGLSKPAMALNFGFDSRAQSIIFPLLSLINLGAISIMPRLRHKLGDYWGIRLLSLIIGIAFLTSTLPLGVAGISTLIAIEFAGNMSDPWIQTLINTHTDSQYRATTISTFSFLSKVPHIFVNIWAGLAIDGSGINSFHFGLGMIITVMTIIFTQYRYLAIKKE